jgi:CheY-like chemotaxis protein
VGGGVAGLAAAIKLKQINESLEVIVLEKGSEIGAHILSGAVVDPKALDELLPEWREQGCSLADVPVVMLTMVEDRPMGFALGANEYLTKPVQKSRVLEAVSRCVAHKSDDILVVEDDPMAADIVMRTVQGDGRKCRHARNGREALSLIHQSRPALIVLDLMMPEMDGFTFLDALRAEDPDFAEIPVVVLTAKDLSSSEQEQLAGRVMETLRKGAGQRENLLEVIHRQLKPA